MKESIIFCCLLLQALSSVHAAEVYRCRDERGGVRFQQHACAPGAGGKVELPSEAMRWDPLRESERRLVKQYRDAERVVYPPSLKKPKSGKRSCAAKQVQLQRVADRLRHGYKIGEGKRLKAQRDRLENYLDRYCE